MAVDQDGRGVGAGGAQIAHDERVAVADLHQLRLPAGAPHVVRGPLRRAPQIGGVAAAGGDRRDPQPVDELIEQFTHAGGHKRHTNRHTNPAKSGTVGSVRRIVIVIVALGLLAGATAIAQTGSGGDAYQLQEPSVTSAQVLRLPSDSSCVRFTRATVRFLPAARRRLRACCRWWPTAARPPA